MLEVFDLVFLAATVVNQSLNIVALGESDVEIQPNVLVYSVEMKQQTPMWVDKCHYQGLMVQYSRDWEEVSSNTGITLPAEPEKPIGYALILTKEKCPENEERQIFNTGSVLFPPFFKPKYVIREDRRVDTLDYASLRDDAKPKWMPQVLKTIELESSNNAAAKEFSVELRQRAVTSREMNFQNK